MKNRRVVGVLRLFTHPNAGTHAALGSDIVLLEVEQQISQCVIIACTFNHLDYLFRIRLSYDQLTIVNAVAGKSSKFVQPGLPSKEGGRLHWRHGLGLWSVLQP